MARLIREPVAVLVVADKPVSFTWRSQERTVAELLDEWRDVGEWWAGEAPKEFWRVRTTDCGHFCLCCEIASGKWTLYKACD